MSGRSDWVRADTPAVPVTDQPTGLSATVVSHDAVTLAWDDPQDDAVTGYVILRRDRAVHPAGTFITLDRTTPARRTPPTPTLRWSRTRSTCTGSGPSTSTVG